MSYERICARNKRLYGDLEAVEHKIADLGPHFFDDRVTNLIDKKKVIKLKIEASLIELEIFWKKHPDGKPARRINERLYFHRVQVFHNKYPDSPPEIIAALSEVKLKTCIKVLNQLANS